MSAFLLEVESAKWFLVVVVYRRLVIFHWGPEVVAVAVEEVVAGATEVAIMGVGVLVEAEGVAMAGVVAQFGPPLLSYENQLLR